MFDGIKIQDVSVSADALLTHERLLFPLAVEEQTGDILDRPRWSNDQGLTFGLIPRQVGGYRVEIKGSLHKFFNEYQNRATLGNSNDFTVNDLLTAINQLVITYNVNPFRSKLNNLEFGVNVRLPFPVNQVLKNLVSYKNRPFTLDTRSETPYYQCLTQRYVVKLYDKGHQYQLNAHVLRVEVKVLKMAYLARQGVQINSLADLLTIANYKPLGALLTDTLSEILFDDSTINPATLTDKERTIYQNGRNPKFWLIPDGLTTKQANTHRQRLHRTERVFRALIARHQRSANWQAQTAGLIGQTWERLATTNSDLLTQIDNCLQSWKNLISLDTETLTVIANNCENTVRDTANCHKLTDSPKPEMSQINPLYLGLKRDNDLTPSIPLKEVSICPVTGVSIPLPTKAGRGVRRFVSATMLRNDDNLLMQLNSQFSQYAKGSKEDEYSRAAHNVRNVESNKRNNLRRRLNRTLYGRSGQQQLLFPPVEVLRLTDKERKLLSYWKGTPFEIPI